MMHDDGDDDDGDDDDDDDYVDGDDDGNDDADDDDDFQVFMFHLSCVVNSLWLQVKFVWIEERKTKYYNVNVACVYIGCMCHRRQ